MSHNSNYESMRVAKGRETLYNVPLVKVCGSLENGQGDGVDAREGSI